MSNEVWKDVIGYEGWYQVSSIGRVKSINRYVNGPHRANTVEIPGKILLPKNNSGYPSVQLYKNSERRTYRIHRLVALSFIGNPENKNDVNHINGIKTDNRLENLEWCTRSENLQHAWDNGLRTIVKPFLGMTGALHHTSKSVSQFDFLGNKINDFGSIKEATRITGINVKSIGLCANGKQRKAGKYIFKFN